MVWEVSEACRRYGMKFGIYLSPWDRNKPCYGSGKEYDDYYLAQLTELLTGYGDIFSVWLDGACGEGPNGKNSYMTGNAIMNVSENISQTHVSVCVGRISGGAEMKLAM